MNPAFTPAPYSTYLSALTTVQVPTVSVAHAGYPLAGSTEPAMVIVPLVLATPKMPWLFAAGQ